MSSIHLLPPSSVDCKDSLKGYIPRTKMCKKINAITTCLRPLEYSTYSEIWFLKLFFVPRQPQWAQASSLLKFQDHTRQEFSGREIGLSQRPLSDSAHHSQERGIHGPAGSESPIPVNKRPQAHALDRAATEIGIPNVQIVYYLTVRKLDSIAAAVLDVRRLNLRTHVLNERIYKSNTTNFYYLALE